MVAVTPGASSTLRWSRLLPIATSLHVKFDENWIELNSIHFAKVCFVLFFLLQPENVKTPTGRCADCLNRFVSPLLQQLLMLKMLLFLAKMAWRKKVYSGLKRKFSSIFFCFVCCLRGQWGYGCTVIISITFSLSQHRPDRAEMRWQIYSPLVRIRLSRAQTWQHWHRYNDGVISLLQQTAANQNLPEKERSWEVNEEFKWLLSMLKGEACSVYKVCTQCEDAQIQIHC